MCLEDLAAFNTNILGNEGINLSLDILEFKNKKYANDLKLSWEAVEQLNQEVLNKTPDISRRKFNLKKPRKIQIADQKKVSRPKKLKLSQMNRNFIIRLNKEVVTFNDVYAYNVKLLKSTIDTDEQFEEVYATNKSYLESRNETGSCENSALLDMVRINQKFLKDLDTNEFSA